MKIDIKTVLPDFAKMCEGDATDVMLTQKAFDENEALLLGCAIKYAGDKGKNVTILAHK